MKTTTKTVRRYQVWTRAAGGVWADGGWFPTRARALAQVDYFLACCLYMTERGTTMMGETRISAAG